MKKYLFLTAILLFSVISVFSQQRKTIYLVADKTINFGITMPANSFVYETDSNNIYRLTAKFISTQDMADVFTSGNYVTTAGGGGAGAIYNYLDTLLYSPTEFSDTTNRYNFSGWRESLFSDYYICEGLILNIGGDTLINIFRQDSSMQHVGNSGLIVQRYSYDDGMNWTVPTVTYNSIYDDRNVIGAILNNGRIMLIFRRYNDPVATIDRGGIYSDDNGSTWSAYSTITIDAAPFGKILLGGDGNHHFISYNDVSSPAIVNMYKSADNGLNWAFQSIVDNVSANISETVFAYIGNDKMIALSRQSLDVSNGTYYVNVSADNGDTWTLLGRSGMNRGQSGVNNTAPFIMYDDVRSRVIAISTTRNNSTNNFHDSIYVYITHPDSAYINSWTEKIAHIRPFPNSLRVYGYPCVCKLSNDNYIGIFTDKFDDKAVLYQFDINYNPYYYNGGFNSNRYSELLPIKNKITKMYDAKSNNTFFNKKPLEQTIYTKDLLSMNVYGSLEASEDISASNINAHTTVSFVGQYAGIYNSGDYSSGFGRSALQYNTGDYSSGFARSALAYNNGHNSNGFGYSALLYNDGDDNSAFGDAAFNAFTEDNGSEKTFASTDIIIGDTIYISGHGFGGVGAYLNLKWTATTGVLPAGISLNTVDQFKITHADTIVLRTDDMTDQGSGNHTLTPQVVYSNSSAFGHNAEPDASNQVILGDGSVTEVKTAGNIVAPTVNTGQGANELYAMNQDVETTDDVGFDSLAITTGTEAGYDIVNATEIQNALTEKYIYYDGVDDYTNIDDVAVELVNTNNTKGTIVWRGRIHDFISDNRRIWSFGDANANEYFLMKISPTNYKIECGAGVAGTTQWKFDTDNTFSENVEYTIVFVQDGTEPYLKINGKLEPITFSVTTDKTSYFHEATGIDNGRLGCSNFNSSGNTNFLNCSVSFFNTWNRILTDSEIDELTLWNSENPPVWFHSVGASNTIITAGSFIVDKNWKIVSVGSTDFTLIGASANTIGIEFKATGVGAGTGTAIQIGNLSNHNGGGMADDNWYDNSTNGLDGNNNATTLICNPHTVVDSLLVQDNIIFSNGASISNESADTFLIKETNIKLDGNAIIFGYKKQHPVNYLGTYYEVKTIDYIVHDMITTTAAWHELYLDGTSTQMIIPENTVWTFNITISGNNERTAQQYSYTIVGCISRDNANNTTQRNSVVTTIWETDANFNVRTSADDATEALIVEVTDSGASGKNVTWCARVEITASKEIGLP